MSDVHTSVGGDQHGVGRPGEHRLSGLHPHQVRPSGGRLLQESGTPGTQLFKSFLPPIYFLVYFFGGLELLVTPLPMSPVYDF
jgi:hypothetical protein